MALPMNYSSLEPGQYMSHAQAISLELGQYLSHTQTSSLELGQYMSHAQTISLESMLMSSQDVFK